MFAFATVCEGYGTEGGCWGEVFIVGEEGADLFSPEVALTIGRELTATSQTSKWKWWGRPINNGVDILEKQIDLFSPPNLQLRSDRRVSWMGI
ncbi:hypothetical protein [Pseudomonas proteolytica]|uniref:hypothetical protein n=1 Tax=Pseudomonas proteolytica TaxID=219574 RepID=UPI0030DC4654